MKKILLVLLLISNTYSYAQQTTGTPTDLPDYTLPSPEAYAFTQYGNTPINESTGKVTASIPLCTFTDGQLSLPISLSYMGNGVKVDQNNTWTGVNWTLNGGGVITRTVYHTPDEEANQRVFDTIINPLVAQYEAFLAAGNTEVNAEVMHQFFMSTGFTWDTQPDIFSFSFMGNSGSFYLDKNFEPVLIDVNSEMNIEILGSSSETNRYNLLYTKEFKITTTDGIAFYFGGVATEETKMEQDYHQTVVPLATTSFYLTRIAHPVDGNIYFQYKDVGAYKIEMSQSKTIYEEGSNRPMEPIVEIMSPGTTNPGPSSIISNQIHNGKYLERIYTNTLVNSISFNSSGTINGMNNFKEVLNDIEIITGSESHKIEFKYLFDYNNTNIVDRFFLEKVIFDNDLDTIGGQHKEFRLVYNDPMGLPKRFSTSQDALGYFNGKNNTNVLLSSENYFPNVTPSYWLPFSGCSTCNADRSTSFAHKTKGTLTKMFYPTGGYTLFEYEPIASKITTTENIVMDIWNNNQNRDPQNKPLDVSGIGSLFINSSGQANSSVFETQSVAVNLSFTAESPLNLDYHDYVSFEVIDRTTQPEQVIYEKKSHFPVSVFNSGTPGTTPQTQFGDTYNFTLVKDHDYEFRLSFGASDSNGTFTTTPVYATLNFDYINGYQLYDEGEGLRVKRVSDFENEISSTAPKNIKKYYYTAPENILKSPIEYVAPYKKPQFISGTGYIYKTMLIDIWGNPQPFTCSLESQMGFSLSINPVNYNEEVITNYTDVTISYGGDNFENGGVAKTFANNLGAITMPMSSGIKNVESAHNNAPWRRFTHGKLLKERTLIKKNDTLYKLKEQNIQYTTPINTYLIGYIGNSFGDCGPGEILPFKNVSLSRYDIFSKNIHLDNQVNIDYIDPLPIAWIGIEDTPNPWLYQGYGLQDHDNDGTFNYQDEQYQALIDGFTPAVDEADYRRITTATNYEYDSYAGQPTKVTTTTSESDKKQITTTTYVDAADALFSLPLTPEAIDAIAAYGTLEAEHRIGSPIQTESFESINDVETLLGKQRTLYITDANGNTLPNVVQSAKGIDDLEDRVIYNKYDANGNPIELKQKDGTTVVYQWASLFRKPTDKIVNATLAEVDTAMAASGNLRIELPNAQVTTYTYTGALHLLRSVTDPRGYTTYYTYDEFNRLKYVKDDDGNILSKNEYNYRSQH